MSGDVTRAIDRVARALGRPDAVDVLVGVAGADLTSFLLEVTRARATRVRPADLVRAARSQRLVEPARADARTLHRTIAAALDALPTAFEVLELAPTASLGTCSAVATVDQTKLVSTVRGLEVAGDPTNMLAVLAAVRRRDGEPGTMRLGAAQRVLRTQPMGAAGQAHFHVLGLVVAGRDRGRLDFERASLVELLAAMVGSVRAVTGAELEVRYTSLGDGDATALGDDLRRTLDGVTLVEDPDRTQGRGYYCDGCFKLVARTADGELEIGDGGFTNWMPQLTGSRKERLLIGGVGLDRLSSLGVT
jgi:hypothetical protein